MPSPYTVRVEKENKEHIGNIVNAILKSDEVLELKAKVRIGNKIVELNISPK